MIRRHLLAYTAAGAALALGCATRGGEPTDAGDAVRVPFDLVRRQVVVEVRIGGRGPYAMLIDTAVSPSGIDLETARALGLDIDTDAGGEAAGTGSGRVPIYPTRIEDLSIGGLEAGTIEAVAMDLGPLGARLGRPLHGVLGYSFLRGRAVRIDYPARTVDIIRGAYGRPVADGGVEFPLELAGTDVHLGPVFVDGAPLDVSLDTGSSLTLEVSGHAVERLGLAALRAAADTSVVRGARGEALVFGATADSLRIGGLTVLSPRIDFPERDRAVDGNLGNGFLRHFVLTVDYVGRRVILEPGPVGRTVPSGDDGTDGGP